MQVGMEHEVAFGAGRMPRGMGAVPGGKEQDPRLGTGRSGPAVGPPGRDLILPRPADTRPAAGGASVRRRTLRLAGGVRAPATTGSGAGRPIPGSARWRPLRDNAD
jgi:hypothetical protein